MRLNFKVGTMPARAYHVCDRKTPPTIGDVFQIVDKADHGSKPIVVRLTEVRAHTGGGVIYFVDQV